MVALYSVTTAGPEYFLPISSESRDKIAAASFFPEKSTGARSGITCRALPGQDGRGRPSPRGLGRAAIVLAAT